MTIRSPRASGRNAYLDERFWRLRFTLSAAENEVARASGGSGKAERRYFELPRPLKRCCFPEDSEC